MKTIREGIPTPPPDRTPPRHDCGMELRSEERHTNLFGRFGTVLECHCGNRYVLRPSGFFRWAVSVGLGNHESRYPTSQYWHGLGRDPKK